MSILYVVVWVLYVVTCQNLSRGDSHCW